jgi:hypothetical protein
MSGFHLATSNEMLVLPNKTGGDAGLNVRIYADIRRYLYSGSLEFFLSGRNFLRGPIYPEEELYRRAARPLGCPCFFGKNGWRAAFRWSPSVRSQEKRM